MQQATPTSQGQALEHAGAIAELAVISLACMGSSLILGIALGAHLRSRGFAWTWSNFALAPATALLAGLILAAPGGAVIVPVLALDLGAVIGVLGYSVYRHLEDRRVGGDREIELARLRRPSDARARRAAERGERGEHLLASEIPIGRTDRGALACIPRGSAESGTHVLIPGTTGAGKTTSLAVLLVEYVLRSGFGAVVIEAKTDGALLDAARGAAQARGTRLHLISPDGPSSYDPLARGSVDERSERLVAAQPWGSEDADFYRQAASPFLRLILRILDAAGHPTTLATVAAYCHPDELERFACDLDAPELVDAVTTNTAGLGKDDKRAIAGMRARLQNLSSSEFARAWLDPERAGVDCIDLRAALERREVIYFRLDTDRTGNIGRTLAQMLLLDLGAAAGSMIGAGVGTFVAIDEFGALEAPALDRLYTRARAAGFSVALGTQTLADLRAAGPAVRERVGATIGAILCHQIGGQEDAEWVAQAIGTVPTWQTTARTTLLGGPTEEGTRTRGYRFEVNPSELQRLAPGEALVARLGDASTGRSARARVVPAWERLPVAEDLSTTGLRVARQEEADELSDDDRDADPRSRVDRARGDEGL